MSNAYTDHYSLVPSVLRFGLTYNTDKIQTEAEQLIF